MSRLNQFYNGEDDERRFYREQRKARMRMTMVKKKRNRQICDFCNDTEAEKDSFFCESCREAQWAKFETTPTAEELDQMEKDDNKD